MGKKRNRNNHNHGKNKKFRHQPQNYWVDDFRESKGDVRQAALTLLVTRVELFDEHTHQKKGSAVAVASIANDAKPEEEKSEAESTKKAENAKSPSKDNSGDSKTESEQVKSDCGARRDEKEALTTANSSEAIQQENVEQAIINTEKTTDTTEDANQKTEDSKAEKPTIDETKELKPSSASPDKKNTNIFICLRRDASAKQKKKKVHQV